MLFCVCGRDILSFPYLCLYSSRTQTLLSDGKGGSTVWHSIQEPSRCALSTFSLFPIGSFTGHYLRVLCKLLGSGPVIRRYVPLVCGLGFHSLNCPHAATPLCYLRQVWRVQSKRGGGGGGGGRGRGRR